MEKILVIGCGGAGKTTLSKKIGAVLGLPVIHLDSHYWLPGWRPLGKEEWNNKVLSLLQAPRWVMDGNYGGTLDIRIDKCDTIVFLDMNRWRCIYNVCKRRIVFAGTNRPEMAVGNKDRLTFTFLYWIWGYRKTRRPGILKQLNREEGKKRVIILQSRKEVNSFISTLGKI